MNYTQNAGPETSTSVFARAGIPTPVVLSRRLIDFYGLPDEELAPARIELAWVVRLILSGCLPAQSIITDRGLVRLAEYCSVDQPASQRQVAVVIAPDNRCIQVVHPDEIENFRKPLLVLLVEDDADVLAMGQLMIESIGYKTVTAGNGIDACRLLDRLLPDAVLTDVNMPGMDGVELCRRIRSTPRTSATPVLVWSGNPGHQQAVMDAGAAVFMAKPVDLHELKDHLRQVLGR